MRLVSFIGYNDGKNVLVRGQLIDQLYVKPQEGDSWWHNLKVNFSRFFAKGISGEKVLVDFNGQKKSVLTSKHGFFTASFKPGYDDWQKAKIVYKKKSYSTFVLSSFVGDGIISDIDDTLLTSHATNLWKKIRLLFFKNSLTRKEVLGMPDFLRSTKAQPFYVSNSTWELFDLIKDFSHVNNLPLGPFLLSNKKLLSLRYKKKNKTSRIETILSGYPNSKFFLVGDDSQSDPVIYKQIAKTYPHRIKAIFIRSTGDNSLKKTSKFLSDLKTPYFIRRTAKELESDLNVFVD